MLGALYVDSPVGGSPRVTHTRSWKRMSRLRELGTGAQDTAHWLLSCAPSLLITFGSISTEPWKNLPVRYGTINFHFAWLPRRGLIVTAPMDLYETKSRNLYARGYYRVNSFFSFFFEQARVNTRAVAQSNINRLYPAIICCRTRATVSSEP